MRILYLGANNGTSLQRFHALERLGHVPFLIDPFSFIPDNRLFHKWYFETGAFGFESYVAKKILDQIGSLEFDLVIVNQGELVGAPLITELKRRFGKVINYNNDLPFGNRDNRKWRIYMKAVPHYDLMAVRSNTILDEVYKCGANKVIPVFMTADEVVHVPVELTELDADLYLSEVLFIGTWFPERGPFMAKLIEAGIPLTVYGQRWDKAQEWGVIRPHWKGSGLHGLEYSKAIQCAKLNLGLLSKENGDRHTSRSIEIPAVGGLLFADRTDEHMQMYVDGEEAVFWGDADECILRCKELLEDEEMIKSIKDAGYKRCHKNNYFNEPLMKMLIDETFKK